MFYKLFEPRGPENLINIKFFELFELDFQKPFKNIEFFEIFEFFEADLLVAPPLLDFPGEPPGKTLEKLKNLKNLNVFKRFLKNQLKNLKKLNVL